MEDVPAPVRVVRVISRLNVGGPAIQAITLAARLVGRGYTTRLVRGVEGRREGALDGLADRLGVQPLLVPSLRRELSARDARSLIALIRILRAERPDVLHTHAAKAGAVGRLAGLTLGRRRPVMVHTFHGHVLEGYFGRRKARVFTAIERLLARRTDCVVTVSDEIREDLVRLGVASRDRIVVIPLGFDLSAFPADAASRDALRRSFRTRHGIAQAAPVVALIARLVPIKRVDRFLAVARLLAAREDVVFLIAGDGELAEQLQASGDAVALTDRVEWLGMTDDVAAVCAASDVVVLTSDNEGTPVSLIEAQAAGTPVVSTDVGGVRLVVEDGASGFVVAPDDDEAFAARVLELLDDPTLRVRFGAAGRERVLRQFSLDRLVDDIDALYVRLLAARRVAR